jgi:hypothetical protein
VGPGHLARSQLKPEPPEIFNTTGIYRLDVTPETAPA